MARMKAAKPGVKKRQATCSPSATTSPTGRQGRDDVARQAGAGAACASSCPRARPGTQLAALNPDEIRDEGSVPARVPAAAASEPSRRRHALPASSAIDEIKKQEARDLTRFDLDFDLPDHLLPEFPAPIFLTTRPDLGDVSQGKLVTIDNFYELFNGILNPKQLEGLRLLLTPFPQQQFNQTEDRRTEQAEPRRRLLRLPRQRPHQRRDPPGRRYPAAGIPPPHRHAVAARREHPAPVRLAARAEDGRGLHRVRAARRLLRRRSGDRHEEGRQHPRARQPGALHGRVPGAARLPAGAEARLCSASSTRARRPRRSCAARRCSSARGSARPATRRRITPTT